LAARCSFEEQLFQSILYSLEAVFWLLAALLKSKSTALRFSLLLLCSSKSEELLCSLKTLLEHEQEQPVQNQSTSESNFLNFKEQEQELLPLLAVLPISEF